ncbi:DUF3846 domain-containing protein [Frondihabitans sp. VKM Ac-2883]|uniref:DUF3846 domain-containing protein n=1 Tax=Frondihabitans sp. VKM Ac-2883 TaxID=2783823 RepID=UPI00188DC4E4|nr:DUF3846 domain-containing protein [Frondihabitans sp. VKM Ac-2883]MBF4577481.1 DUF3846 domain-containing protein [Frondihabitans sp. VKM Ac-2883]
MTTTTNPTTETGTGFLLGIRVSIDGSIQDVRIPATEGAPDFLGITKAIGCDVFDVVGLPDGIDVFVDDEGLYRAEHNPVLSEMVRHSLDAPLDYRLHGAGLFLGSNDEGDTLALTPAQRATVAAAWFPASPLAFL